MLLVSANEFSSGEQILFKGTLDLCNGSGHVSLWNILSDSGQENYRNVLVGLRYLRRIEQDGPEMVWRQPKTAYC